MTPDSLLALHAAGYRAVRERIGHGLVLDLGCGQGFESVRLGGDGRHVFGVDYSEPAARQAGARFAGQGLHVLVAEATALALGTGRFDWVCSSHLVEHFTEPGRHVGEMARVLAADGRAFVLTPNAPADFENPFHVSLFRADGLRALLSEHFGDVSVYGLDAGPAVKEDFARRRRRAGAVLRLDVLRLRRRLPRSWYLAAYTRLLPLAYRMLARGDSGGGTGITEDEFFVTDDVDDSTPVLLAIASHPRRAGA